MRYQRVTDMYGDKDHSAKEMGVRELLYVRAFRLSPVVNIQHGLGLETWGLSAFTW